MRRCFLYAVTSLALCTTSCGADTRTLLQRSCDGEAVLACAPFTYAVVTEASIDPPMLEVGDLGADAMVHVRLQDCGSNTPAAHTVHIQALVTRATSLNDAGFSTMVFDVGTVYDSGTGGDAIAADGVLDAVIPNPFTSDYPDETTITLRFVPRGASGCEGNPLEVDYILGPLFVPGGV